MKKSFKRFLSSVLATVMTVSVLSIGMVSEAFAATVTTSSDGLTKTWDYSSGNTAATLAAGDTFDGIVVTAVGSGVKIAASNLSIKAGAEIRIPVPADSAGKLTLYASATQSTRYATLEGNNIVMTKPSSSGDFTTAETADGYLDLTFYGGEYKPTKIEVTLTTGTFGEVSTYTLTGSVSGLSAGTNFDLTDGTTNYVAEVGADGTSYTISTQSGAFDTSKTYTASLRDYSVSYGGAAGVTVSGSDTTFTATPAIEFTKLELAEIAAGTYTPADIESGLPNFDISGLTVASTGKYTGSLGLILSNTATITVNGKSGSSTSGRYATVAIGDEIYTADANVAAADNVFYNVPAGAVSIDFAGNNTQFQVVSITIEYSSTPVTTYTWALDTSNLTIGIDTAKLGFAKATTTATTNTLTYSGTDYILNDANATVTGTPDDNNQITVVPEDSWFTEIVSAEVITDKATLTFDDLVGVDTTASDIVTGYFTIIAGSSSAIEANNFTFDGLGAYASRYKTGGKTTLANSVPSNRAIKFATADAAVVQIAARASGTGSRSLNVYDSTGTILGSITTADTNGHILTVALPNADTYYIASDNGFTVYSVNVVVDETITDGTNNGKVFTDTTDAYLIANVTAAQVADTNNSEVSISVNGNTPVSSDVVYKAAIIDGQYVTAEELGADFIYVVKAVGATLDNVKDFVVSFVTAE